MSAQLSPLRFFSIWLSLGMQSFGGGVATFALIREASVTRYSWVSEEEFTREWAMVLLVPGINLLALTILIGKRARGTAGIFLAMAGLLLPSVLLTVLITAAYAHIRDVKQVQSALRGAVPAIVAIGLLTSVQMAQPILKSASAEGRSSLALSVLIISIAGLLVISSRVPIVGILLISGGICGAARWLSQPAIPPSPTEPTGQ